MSLPLIGLTGMARSGKDTAGVMLEQIGLTHGDVLCRYSFAEPMKTMLKSVFGDHFHEGDRSGICPESGVSYRTMMQTLGTEWGRSLNPQLWVNLVEKRWKQDAANGCGTILTDVRFDSEAQWIKMNGGVIIKVVRAGDEGELQGGVPGHASEVGIKPMYVDGVIINNHGLDDLRKCCEWQYEHVVNRGR